MTEDQIKDLLKLSGMIYKPGYYTASQWEAKTGVNPENFPRLFKKTSSGLCVWTAQAESIVQAHNTQTRHNWESIGVQTT
jgi:hypothetical protein